MRSSVVYSCYFFVALLIIFCFAYPFAVIGIAFNVQPPFSLAWAGSTLLFLEGTLLIIAAMLLYGWWRGLLAGLSVILGSYLVETVGVATGLPFGSYLYTAVLLPRLPGSVPLSVTFAWVLIVFGSYGLLKRPGRKVGVKQALLAALLAMLLDLAIEPVAAHIVHYWTWLSVGSFNYYGVPPLNFLAWFVVAWLFLLLVDLIVGSVSGPINTLAKQADRHTRFTKRVLRLIILLPWLLFGGSLFMFGLVDLTHGYYWAALLALLAGVIIILHKRSTRVFIVR